MVAVDFCESFQPLPQGKRPCVCLPSCPKGNRLTHPLCGLRHLCAVALRQGRYKAILLDSDALGPVSRYIHLNPVRAGLVSVEQLQDFVDSSFHQMWHPRRRWSFCRFDCFLEAAGGLVDKPRDRVLYRDYLAWLSSQPSERRRLGFENMVRGWVKSSPDFKQAVLKDLSDAQIQKVVEFDAAEMREPRWERAVIRAMKRLGRTDSELRTEAKGAEWKVAVARHLRERCLTPNRWIAERLNMGASSSVQSHLWHRALRREPKLHRKRARQKGQAAQDPQLLPQRVLYRPCKALQKAPDLLAL